MNNLQQAADYLSQQNLTIVTAESCTAGLIAGALADMPGCGSWFKMGYVTYSAGAKNNILGVRHETIDRYNLTSEEVAREMVEGALRLSGADIAVSTTGVAGPDPGEGGIPPGTVCFAWGFRHGDGPRLVSETRHFDGDRNAVRLMAADYAIGRVAPLHAQYCQSTSVTECLKEGANIDPQQVEASAVQRAISQLLDVSQTFDAQAEITRRSTFLGDQLRQAGLQTLVLGISGGVDSLVAGLLAQRAVQRLRDDGHEARFIAMRLPYGDQKDEAEAQAALAVIQPDELLTVNIKPASDAMLGALRTGGLHFDTPGQEDFILGNIKARQRMIAQYAVAGARRGLVIGTDHAAEALMGFFTKFGDGACDVAPLTGLNKRRVRALGTEMGASDELVQKVPTADLENHAPLKPDEEVFGVRYEEIDDFLEGRTVSARAFDIILKQYKATAHKRRLPAAP